ncbi:hypothetical protein Back11_35130 [Paenibacillus baekrokdamisoli]|uniref:Uncharacterized protein n=1 Tax=Paenibacillus baekrokdamisoli TaxID=1712516 RepID=A0A3G9JDU3_9BACL|nr:helix-turn-helix domain-containing protein [Paenibacillus baekrokdamisoli]MBB3070893.1 two-component system response regulator YesN [Paenibacillus baekrokdamisoli]BBH22168.1 hypothetical protein Back11_35130 [Paenibacillus baekrokdamisoli]
MLKIVIAEDAAFEREGLVRSIPWNDLGIVVVGAAEDGKQAWELIVEHNPDIVLTDIKMPIVDGIELSKAVNRDYPLTKLVFISGHEDFNFALEAIKSKVLAYILKPYTFREITDTIRQVALICMDEKGRDEQIRIIQSKLDETRPFFEEKLLQDIINERIQDELTLNERLQYYGLYFDKSCFAVILLDFEATSVTDHALSDNLYIIRNRPGELILLINEDQAHLNRREDLEAIAVELKDRVNARLQSDVAICVSRPFSHLLNLAYGCKEVLEAKKRLPMVGRIHPVFYEDVTGADDVFGRLDRIVADVKRFIRLRYMDNITLNDIASEVFMSPNYLNSLFKKATGKNINKYLIDFRITTAMELLLKPDATVNRVAEKVGYRNLAHFSTLFKKQCGMTPMEYRDYRSNQ